MEKYLTNFKNCLQKEVPFCQAECPFHMDVLEFIEKLKRGNFTSAYKTYKNAVGFPAIVSNLCNKPCQNVCPKKDIDKCIDLHLLEKSCIEFSNNTTPTDYNLPKKKESIAIIGAGISGLACALRLSTKKYDVTIFEKNDKVGGHLWNILEPALFLDEIERQFQFEEYTLKFGTPIFTLNDFDYNAYNCVYVATGFNGVDFGLLSLDKPCKLINNTAFFAGGSLIKKNSVDALADGLKMSTAIDNYLKTKNLQYINENNTTAACLDSSRLIYSKPILPINSTGFTKEESQAEAHRCLECQCDACRIYCDLTEYVNKWPLRIRDEIQATTLPGSAEVKATPAKRLINTCNQCGLCLETCPQDIDLGGLILAARKSMHRQNKMPWAFHDFWIRDMEFSNGDMASIVKGSSNCKFAFFPGCQLGASDPNLIIQSMNYLLEHEPNTGLILKCCGIPAQWSGNESLFTDVINSIKTHWSNLGKPTLVLTCPTCSKTFKEFLPMIDTITIYELMEHWDINKIKEKINKTYSIFDPCSTRNNPSLKKSIRVLSEKRGITVKPLSSQEQFSHCCGYGGHVSIADPKFAKHVTQKRIGENTLPYITYCINCRDTFLAEGKETDHILGIYFNEPTPKNLPTVSERRDNRIYLKKLLLEKFWNEKIEINCTKYPFKLSIDVNLKNKLSDERILESDIMNVVDFCERTGRTIKNLDKDTYSGYRQIGQRTYWVEYKKISKNKLELTNAYSHRMKIELEVVWNGTKIQPLV